MNIRGRRACHAGPDLNLALPVAEGGEGGNDDVGPVDAQELPLERQSGNRLRSLAQALRTICIAQLQE